MKESETTRRSICYHGCMLRKFVFLFCFSLLFTGGSAEELLTTTELHVRSTGYGGAESATYKVFAATLAKGESSRAVFEECLKDGPAAAKLYGAIGLYHLDPEAGRQALLNLRTDQSKVKLLQGCIMSEQRVGDLAAQLLSEDNNTLSFRSFIP